MENEDPLWIQVEISMAMWCAFSKKSDPNYQCTCPRQDQLQEASPEALTRILSALEENNYSGAWKDYLDD